MRAPLLAALKECQTLSAKSVRHFSRKVSDTSASVLLVALASAMLVLSSGQVMGQSVAGGQASGSGQATTVEPVGTLAHTSAPSEAEAVRTYLNATHRLSFVHPVSWRIVEVPLEGSQALLVAEGEQRAGFQVFLAPYDEPLLSPERIQADLPELVMERAREVSLGGAPALAFNSLDPDIGPTYEVWCVHGGVLYQVMTYADFEEGLNGILATWRFLE